MDEKPTEKEDVVDIDKNNGKTVTESYSQVTTKFICLVSKNNGPIGKGIFSASTGKILLHLGYKVSYFKIDTQPEIDNVKFHTEHKGGCFIKVMVKTFQETLEYLKLSLESK
jgi:hypothetical protein